MASSSSSSSKGEKDLPPSPSSRARTEDGKTTQNYAPSGAIRLPDPGTFLTSLSTFAFVAGLGGAIVYSIRKGRREALRESLEAGRSADAVRAGGITPGALSRTQQGVATRSSANAAPSTSRSSIHASNDAQTQADQHNLASTSRLPSAQVCADAETETKGPLALFAELNKAILPRSKSRQVKKSVFDSEGPGAPLSVLTRRSGGRSGDVKGKAKDPSPGAGSSAPFPQTSSSADNTLHIASLANGSASSDYQKARSEEHGQGQEQEPDQEQHESPLLYTLKAFGIATGLVAVSATLIVALVRRTLGVNDVDDFVLKMAELLPSRTSGARALAGLGIPGTSSSSSSDQLPTASHPPSETPTPMPMPLDEALEALDQATGDEFVRLLNAQLDGEHREDVQERMRRRAERVGR